MKLAGLIVGLLMTTAILQAQDTFIAVVGGTTFGDPGSFWKGLGRRRR